ncbi:MAG: 3-isopropylmalate dehydratase [Gammaproteobacteria bacterium]
MSVIRGKAWVFGDEINTDVMAPGIFFKESIEVMAQHCLEAVDPEFATHVERGDIVVAGNNFGVGSAREQAPMALVHLGVGAVIAESFSRIFYRNAINFGLPLLLLPEAKEITAGDILRIDVISGHISNESTGAQYKVSGIPAHLMQMIDAGGLMPFLKQKYSR